jgi:hypothetical protein
MGKKKKKRKRKKKGAWAHSDHSAHLTSRVGPIPNSTARPAYHSPRASRSLTIEDHWSAHHARSVIFGVSLLGGPMASGTTRTASPGHGWGKVCYEALIKCDGVLGLHLSHLRDPSSTNATEWGDFRESAGRRRREFEVVDLGRTCGVRWWLESFARPRRTCMTRPRD